MTKVGAKVPAVVKTDASRLSVLGASRMPSVLHQSQLSAGSTSRKGGMSFHYYKRYSTVTAPASWGDLAKDLPHFPLVPASARNATGVGRLRRTIGILCRPSFVPPLPMGVN